MFSQDTVSGGRWKTSSRVPSVQFRQQNAARRPTASRCSSRSAVLSQMHQHHHHRHLVTLALAGREIDTSPMPLSDWLPSATRFVGVDRPPTSFVHVNGYRQNVWSPDPTAYGCGCTEYFGSADWQQISLVDENLRTRNDVDRVPRWVGLYYFLMSAKTLSKPWSKFYFLFGAKALTEACRYFANNSVSSTSCINSWVSFIY